MVRARLAKGELSLYAWVYKIQTGDVFQFEHDRGQFAPITGEDRMKPIPSTMVNRGSNGQDAGRDVSN